MSTKLAPRTGAEASTFLVAAHKGPLKWKALCLALQRQARGLPAVYPSALSAALATPAKERVTNIMRLEAGMVAYSDDPNDGNPYGHIYFIQGWNGKRDPEGDNLLTWTNDARRTGGVDLVPLSFYRDAWGDKFQFGATWLNGYDFAEFNSTPRPRVPTLGGNLDAAIADIRRGIRTHRAQAQARVRERDALHRADSARPAYTEAIGEHRSIVRALTEDLHELQETRRAFPKAGRK